MPKGSLGFLAASTAAILSSAVFSVTPERVIPHTTPRRAPPSKRKDSGHGTALRIKRERARQKWLAEYYDNPTFRHSMELLEERRRDRISRKARNALMRQASA